jgi:hypothetical protein
MARVLTILVVASCATSPPPAPNAAPAVTAATGADQRGAVRIVDARYGVEHSARAVEMTMPFGANQNGNELVVAALERARQAGAAYIGELAITMTFRWGGAPIECRTQVRFERDPEDPSAAPAPPPVLPASAGPQYGTDVETFRPARVAFVAEDRELACERATSLASCSWRDVTRSAERYDYEGKVGFVPPNWPHLAERFAAGRLVPAEPSCYRIEEAELAKSSPYRLSAVAYHREVDARPGEGPRHESIRDGRESRPQPVDRRLQKSPDSTIQQRRDAFEQGGGGGLGR